MKYFVTGSAGFIGFHTARALLEAGHEVLGFDGFTPYYDPRLKRDRDAQLRKHSSFTSVEGMLEDAPLLHSTINGFQPDVVIHLAAQAGVRYSIENPEAYIQSNIIGTFNLLEVLKERPPVHLLLASTSSVYGGNPTMPFAETQRTGFPVSLYAATKSACETMSHAYAGLHQIPTTCFRFFTVYGPWGRPDMALFKFVDAIKNDEEIEIYGNGLMSRDFTYVDDLVEGIVRLINVAPECGKPVSYDDSLSPVAPWRVVNIAGGSPVPLLDFVEAVETALGARAKRRMLPMQPGDVTNTLASPALLHDLTGFTPHTPVTEGVVRFVQWHAEYHADGS